MGDRAEGFGDVVVPLWYDGEGSLLFLNPRATYSDNDEEEFNLGLGYRLLSQQDIIFGINGFFDHRNTQFDNEYEQWGLGIEVLGPLVDFRAAYYKPDDDKFLVNSVERESVNRSQSSSTSSSSSVGDIFGEGNELNQNVRTITRRTVTTTTTTTKFRFEQFETALEGWDAGLGVRLPWLDQVAETRLFIGYQQFDNPFGDDLEGFKRRVEVRLMPGITLDGEVFENNDISGSDYYVGARVRVPFDLARLAHGRNPMEGATDDFKRRREAMSMEQRMTEMIMRDPQVRVTVSDPVENIEARTTTTSKSSSTTTSSKKKKITVLDDVQFVNNTNSTGVETGTFEHPWNTIQEGANNIVGQNNVYVFQGNAPYQENVTVSTDGTRMLGEGCAIEGLADTVLEAGCSPWSTDKSRA